MTATWTPGEHRGIAWPSGIALFPGDLDAAVVNRVWERIVGSGPDGVAELADFLARLSDEFGDAVPDFAVAVSPAPPAGTLGADAHLAARGRFRVVAQAQGERVELVGAGGQPMQERRVRRATAVRLSAAASLVSSLSSSGAGLVLASGVVPAAAVSLGMPLPETPSLSPPPVSSSSPTSSVPPLQPAPPRPDFISAVPGFGGAAAAPVSAPVSAPEPLPETGLDSGQWAGDHDGETVARLGFAVPAHAVPQATSGAGELLAVLCNSGHANPPQRPTCRVCGFALASPPMRVPRPSLGRVFADSGESLPLVAPVVVGRSPRASDLGKGAHAQLLKLPASHISASHVALRIEDWNVLAMDLGSTNGTFVRRQGQPPVRLPDTAHLLVPGDVLDLGHGVHLRFEELP